jgi:hypothetical protein
MSKMDNNEGLYIIIGMIFGSVIGAFAAWLGMEFGKRY